MKIGKTGVYLALLVAVGVVAPLAAFKASADPAIVAAITKMENDSIKADLAGDKAWFEKNAVDDYMGCDSNGKWFSKAEIVSMMADTKSNNYKSEKMSDLKVRVYGTTAVATYSDTYDAMVLGEHRMRTILATDVFVKMGNDWKVVSGHATPLAK